MPINIILVEFFTLFHSNSFDLNAIRKATLLTIQKIGAIQVELNVKAIFKLNIVITDGKKLIATRYISDASENPLSLHYTIGDHIKKNSKHFLMQKTEKNPGAIIIASEPLTDFSKEWENIPRNHMLIVDEQLKVELIPINI